MYVTYTNMTIMEDIRKWMSIRLAISTCVVVLMYVILRRINPYIILMANLIAVSILDLVDSIPLQMQYEIRLSDNEDYQQYDKISDMIVYLVVIILHLAWIREIGTFEIILLSLYLFRLIGVALYTYTGDRLCLVAFPNFMVDNVILYLYLRYILHSSSIWPVVVSVPLKIAYEFVHHVLWKRWT